MFWSKLSSHIYQLVKEIPVHVSYAPNHSHSNLVLVMSFPWHPYISLTLPLANFSTGLLFTYSLLPTILALWPFCLFTFRVVRLCCSRLSVLCLRLLHYTHVPYSWIRLNGILLGFHTYPFPIPILRNFATIGLGFLPRFPARLWARSIITLVTFRCNCVVISSLFSNFLRVADHFHVMVLLGCRWK